MKRLSGYPCCAPAVQAALPYLTNSGCRSSPPIPLFVTAYALLPVLLAVESLLGFALQRANSRMLRNSDRRRRNARACGKYSSGTRPPSPLTSSDDDY